MPSKRSRASSPAGRSRTVGATFSASPQSPIAVTLENLSVALHGVGQGHPEKQHLLEGYFALKRETAVELLAACCELASEEDVRRATGAPTGRARRSARKRPTTPVGK